jgi:very-short-patch-repair endonuclease
MSRPLFYSTIAQLSAQVGRNMKNDAELALVEAELNYRDSKAAKELLQFIGTLRSDLKSTKSPVFKPSKSTATTRLAPKQELADAPQIPSPKADPMTDDQRRWTEEAVASLRKKLLDLSKKNPLISYKHSSRGGSHLRIVDERPDLLFAALNDDAMEFEPLPGEEVVPPDERTPQFQIAYERGRLTDEAYLKATENLGDHEDDARAWQQAERELRKVIRKQLGLPAFEYGKALDVIALAKAHGFDPSYDLKNSDEPLDDHHQDNHIRVLFTRNELEKQLKKIWEKYKSHARETGLHTLFLVFGFVQWYEDEASDVALHAPLLLLSTELERKPKRGRYDYTLAAHGDGLQVNVALAEKMRESFGIELPQLRENEEPESYFVRTAELLAKSERLSLRRFATLAVLPFPRMVLWKDLDPDIWPDGAFSDHPLLPMLLRAKSSGGSSAMGETHDIDSEQWATKAPPLIALADASQHSALIDIVAGKSIAIEGPPGTGKSQTITNMIAGALDAGKRVLFIAEKQAALSVVAARLRERGFGPLLLELHSDNTNRTKLYESIRQRLKAGARSDAEELQSKRQELFKQRDVIRRYLGLIGTNLGAIGRSAYWLAWREIKLRTRFEREIIESFRTKFVPVDSDKITSATVEDVRSKLDIFTQQLIQIEAHRGDGERTRWTEAKILPSFDQTAQLSATSALATSALNLASAEAALSKILTLNMPQPGCDLKAAIAQLEQLEAYGAIDEAIMVSALNKPEQARSLLARQFRWRQLCDHLRDDVAEPGNVAEAAVTHLQNMLKLLDQTPANVNELAERIDLLKQIVSGFEAADESIDEFLQGVGSNKLVSVQQAAAMASVIVELANASDIVAAIYHEKLLEPLASHTAVRERALAMQLVEERTELAALTNSEAFQTPPAELEDVAAILSETGVFARLVSGRYREAKRKAGRLLPDVSNREEASSLIRKVAKNVVGSKVFFDDSPARAMFPLPLWQGDQSDWSAIEDAIARTKKATDVLGQHRCDKALQFWLDASARDRNRIASMARSAVSVLNAACAAGFEDNVIAELPSIAASRLRPLHEFNRALADVGIRPQAMIIRDGEMLPARLSAVKAAFDDFNRLANGESFGWVGAISEPLDSLSRAMDYAEQLEAFTDSLGLADAMKGSTSPVSAMADLVQSKDDWLAAAFAWRQCCDDFDRIVGGDAVEFAGQVDGWRSLAERFAVISDDEAGARLAASLLRYARTLTDIGCSPFVEAALSGRAPVEGLSDLYELIIVRSILDHYLGGDGAELAGLGSLTVDAARKAFTRIDKLLHELEARAIVGKRLTDKPPRGNDYGPRGSWTEQSLLDHELGLKKPRTPIRDITHRAGGALQALKPVWMMSPASAAQYIRAGSFNFDLLVVDEASQMRPEYAVSSIMRGQQFVVVGDTNQLPPTDVFAMSTDSDDDGLEDDAAGGGMKVDTESILDLANERFRDRRRLKWHYRSQHESLIQFSNRQFYDRDLVVFPSPTTDDELLGVKHRFVEGAVYDASINQKEAEAVIEEAFGLMRAYPQYSMGIATMNAKQAELIQAEFDRLILEAPEVRQYVDAHAGSVEEFFIKNLENVQGDERDIIIISTVYGPSKDGVVLQRFGLMNREVGWRRLNVLVTRAKLSTRLITSLRSSDIKITPTTSRGPIALQAYLNYAENGAQYEDASGGPADSDFEIFVGDALRAAGYEVVQQVGVEGFRIDLGVKHVDCPGGFIAGIECDGARFHSGLSVRDRDRIRQSILEGLGWHIYRIWSTDWFQDPGRETAKLLAVLDELRRRKAESFAGKFKSDSVDLAPENNLLTELPSSLANAAIESVEIATDPIAGVISFDGAEADDEPTGKAMTPIDGIEWYETDPKRVYVVWADGQRVGDVVVVSRPTAGPQRVYGEMVRVPLPEYRGTIFLTGDNFVKHDIYATVREVARRAKEIEP